MKSFETYLKETEEKEMNEGTYAELGLSEKSRERVYGWLKDYGIKNLTEPSTYHCTVVFSRKSIPELYSFHPEMPILAEIKGYHIFPTQNGKKCLVLDIDNPSIQAIHKQAEDLGATWDFPEYKPHITISLDYDGDMPKDFPPFKVMLVSFHVEKLDLSN